MICPKEDCTGTPRGQGAIGAVTHYCRLVLQEDRVCIFLLRLDSLRLVLPALPSLLLFSPPRQILPRLLRLPLLRGFSRIFPLHFLETSFDRVSSLTLGELLVAMRPDL